MTYTNPRPRHGKQFLYRHNFSGRSAAPGSEGWVARREQEALAVDTPCEILLVHAEPHLPLVLEILAYLSAVHRTVRADTINPASELPQKLDTEERERFRAPAGASEVLLYLHTVTAQPASRTREELELFREVQREKNNDPDQRIGIMPLLEKDGTFPSYHNLPWLSGYPEVGVDRLAWFCRRFRFSK